MKEEEFLTKKNVFLRLKVKQNQTTAIEQKQHQTNKKSKKQHRTNKKSINPNPSLPIKPPLWRMHKQRSPKLKDCKNCMSSSSSTYLQQPFLMNIAAFSFAVRNAQFRIILEYRRTFLTISNCKTFSSSATYFLKLFDGSLTLDLKSFLSSFV